MPWNSIPRCVAYGTVLPIFLAGCATPLLQSEREPALPALTPVVERSVVSAAPTTAAVRTPTPDRAPPPSVREKAAAAPISDTWRLLGSEFTWPEHTQPAIALALSQLIEHRTDFELASQQAAPYLWFIRETLKERHLPAELALVPLIESSYRATARSPRGAAGLWQFMPATGRRYKLKQTAWYDERQAIIASTHAALDYLEHLAQSFDGDWLLAVAAYNCGPAKVRRAITKNGSQDFWQIAGDLPRETAKHVPKLLASIKIIANPDAYGLSLHPISNVPSFKEIDIGDPLDLRGLFTMEGWSKDEFKRLNPAFKRDYTDPDGPFRILAPPALEAQIIAQLASLKQSQRPLAHTHVVAPGDTVSEIAERYGVSVRTLRKQNNIRRNLIRVGTKLTVYAPQTNSTSKNHSPRTTQQLHHTVARGESLWIIARRYRTTTKKLAAINGITHNKTLQPGDRILVGRGRTPLMYEVVRGDSLWTIARKFAVSVKELRRWNDLGRRRMLRPGQSLVVSRPNQLTTQET